MAITKPPIDEPAIDGFRERVRGAVLSEGDDGYDEARRVWNAMIDRTPALVVRPTGTADVMTAVAFAREHDLLLSVKGGGHNVAGNAVCDDGLMIDLSAMNAVRVDPAARIVHVGPGATLGDVDHETQAFGLATPLGTTSFTGVAGLALGGGIGWLSRPYGLTLDNLRAAEVVTADARRVPASEDEHPDLFWAVRGGGGNFGIVTAFEFDLHAVGPEVLAGPVVYAGEDAAAALRFVREFTAEAPDEATVAAVLRKAPPLPFLPADVHGTDVAIVAAFYAGDIATGERVLQPVREFGEPIADAVGPVPYAAWQQAFDGLYEPGARNYWKSAFVTDLPDDLLAAAASHAAATPTPEGELAVFPLGGAVNRVPADATAYPHRDVDAWVFIRTRWSDPADDDACIAWTRSFFDGLPAAGAYVNFVAERRGDERLAYGGNYDRLVDLKAKYDPDNRFRMNQNISPTA